MMRWLIGLWSIFFLSSLLQAKTPPVDEASVIDFDSGQLSYLRDPTRALSLDQVRDAAANGQFKTLSGNLGLGYVPDAAWLHLSLERTAGQAKIAWLEIQPAYLDRIELFHISPSGAVNARVGGDSLPQSAKEEDYRATLFKLPLEPGRHEIYLRITTTSTLVAAVKLWQPEAFARHVRNNYFGYGLYFSLVLTVLLFNAVNWLLTRRAVFIIYAAYLSLNTLQWLGINGFISEFIFPSHPLLANLTLGISLSLSGAMAFLFYIIVLEQRRYHPVLYRFGLFGIVACVVTAVATPLGHYQKFAPVLLTIGIVAIGSIPWPTKRLWAMGNLWARLLAMAYVTYGVLLAINILGAMALIPFGAWNIYTGMASNVCHVLLLHFAILLHYRRIERAHAEAIETAALAKRQVDDEKRRSEEQDKLLAMITHEIRTPVAVISAATQSLEVLDDRPGPERGERYERIRRSVTRLTRLLDLAIAREKAGNHDITVKEHLVPASLANEVRTMVGESCAQRVRLEFSPHLPLICGDGGLLRFALLNLIDNACKYGSTDARIIFGARQHTAAGRLGVLWTVSDSGPGIPLGLEEIIFEKYRRCSESGEGGGQAGLGLGLYLARKIFEQHQGWLKADPAYQNGARFVGWLPAEA